MKNGEKENPVLIYMRKGVVNKDVENDCNHKMTVYKVNKEASTKDYGDYTGNISILRIVGNSIGMEDKNQGLNKQKNETNNRNNWQH